MQPYPQVLPYAEATLAFEIMRSGQVAARKIELAQALWTVQGYAQKTLIGEMQVFSGSDLHIPKAEKKALGIDADTPLGVALTPDQLDEPQLMTEEEYNTFIDLQNELHSFAGIPQTYASEAYGAGRFNWAKLLEILLKLAPVVIPLVSDEA